MIVGFKYLAMKITGAMHLALGVFCLISAIISFTTESYYEDYYRRSIYKAHLNIASDISKQFGGAALVASLWIIAVGIIGIFTGVKSNPDNRTNTLKIVYMILSILSACIFSIGGIVCFSYEAVWILVLGSLSLYYFFSFAAFVMFVEFVLAIVSSSICCCCPSEVTAVTPAAPNVVVMQGGQASGYPSPGYVSQPYPQVTGMK